MVRNSAATSRPKKRHLVRWTPEMDMRLLLTIQSQCNLQNVGIPWDDIGPAMGQGISGGACIQHMAKLRTRMVQSGLPVPPPLRRGGGTNILSAPNTSRARQSIAGSATTTRPSTVAPVVNAAPSAANTSTAKKTPAKKTRANVGKKRLASVKSTSNEPEDEEYEDIDSDPGYREPIAKRKRSSTVKRSPALGNDEVKVENNDDKPSRVASGAPFLSLGSGGSLKAEEPKIQEDKEEPSLIVSLGVYYDGDNIVKKDEGTNSSEAETDIEIDAAIGEACSTKSTKEAGFASENGSDIASLSHLSSSDLSASYHDVPTSYASNVEYPSTDEFRHQLVDNSSYNLGNLSATNADFEDEYSLADIGQPPISDSTALDGLPLSSYDSNNDSSGHGYFGSDGVSYGMPFQGQLTMDSFHYSNHVFKPNSSADALPHLSSAFQSADSSQGPSTMVNTTTNHTPVYAGSQEHRLWPAFPHGTANAFDGEGGYFDSAFEGNPAFGGAAPTIHHGFFDYKYQQ